MKDNHYKKKCCSNACILHRYALLTKKMPNLLKSVLDNTVNIVKFIKGDL